MACPTSSGMYTGGGRSSTGVGCEVGEQRPERVPTMTDVELPRAIHLAKGAIEGRIVEQRVVSESARPARLAEDLARHFASKGAQHFPAFGQCDHTNEPGGTVRFVPQPLEQQAIVRII